MSRLFTVMQTIPDIMSWLGAEACATAIVPSETVEGTPGLVMFENDGRRVIRQMHWGFPRLTREMRSCVDPLSLIGLVADLTNPMWERLVVEPRYRCLIPLTHFANPDGDPGKKTRTWFSAKETPMVAWAGFCRNTPEQGPVFAGMTMTANALIEPYNERMPVLLEPHEFDAWLHGSIEDVIHFQFRAPFAAERMSVVHTEDIWRSGKQPPLTGAQLPQMALQL